METKEKTSNENKWWGTVEDKQKMAETMNKCFEGMNWAGDCRSMMAQCMKGCRWFPLIPVVFGITLFLLGYYLDAEIIKVLWMIAAGFVVLMGSFGLLMMSLSRRMCC